MRLARMNGYRFTMRVHVCPLRACVGHELIRFVWQDLVLQGGKSCGLGSAARPVLLTCLCVPPAVFAWSTTPCQFVRMFGVPTVRVMANAVPHTLFQWSLSCLQLILLFLSFIGTLLSYYTLVFRFTLLSSPCVGTIQFLHKRAYIHCLYSVSGLSWYQRQSLAPFWLSSRLLVLRSTVLSPIPSTVPVTV